MKNAATSVFLCLLLQGIQTSVSSQGLAHYQKPFRLQEESEERFVDRLRFGGNLGLQFGTYTSVLISPSVGYVPKAEILGDKLMLGVGVTYMYNRIKYQTGLYESHIYGGRTFLRYLVFDNFFAYTEHEFLNAAVYQPDQLKDKRQWVNGLYLGAGYLLRFSDRGGITITALYNLLWTPTNPIYASPWDFRIGFML